MAFCRYLKRGCGAREPLITTQVARYDERSFSCGKEIAMLDVAIMIEGQDGINRTRWRMAQTFRDETLI
jgi:hypothetical protein